MQNQLIVALFVGQLTKAPSMRSIGFAQALVAQRIRASDYGSEGREFESLQARFLSKLPEWQFFFASEHLCSVRETLSLRSMKV